MKIFSISEPIASTAQQNTDVPTFTIQIAFDVPQNTPEAQQMIKHQYDVDTQNYWAQNLEMMKFRQERQAKDPQAVQEEEPLDGLETDPPRLDLYLTVTAQMVDGPIQAGTAKIQYPTPITRFDIEADSLTTEKRPFIQDTEETVKATQSEIVLDTKRQLEDTGFRGDYNIAVSTTYRGQPHGREVIPQYNDQPQSPAAPSPRANLDEDELYPQQNPQGPVVPRSA